MDSSSGQWVEFVYEYGELIPLDDFLQCVSFAYFTDWDGSGYAVNKPDEKMWSQPIRPSQCTLIPKHTTHIIWYNK